MNENFSEKGHINKTALLGHTIIAVVLALAYALELLKGSRTVGYYMVFALLCIVPVVVEHILYRRNREDKMIQHIMGTCYGILYLFAIWTTHSLLTCMYAFPMFLVIILYMDVRFCVIIGTGAFLGNVACVVRDVLTTGYTAEEIPDVEIRIAAVLITAVYMAFTTAAVKKVNQVKMQAMQAQAKAAGAQAETILTTSGSMISDIKSVSEKVEQLGESMEQIHTYMGEVSSGSTETAESIQQQMHKTEIIQQHIARVKDTAMEIEENMGETVDRVETGKRQMDALAKQVESSMAANRRVLTQMKELSEYTSQMNTIIETITSIANSTGMLALNASIEAARAGEAGRGFAVVASQISGLANQTKSATVNITELIGHINQELVDVEAAVDVVTESNKANAESTQVVTENFVGITQGTENVGQQTKELMNIVDELESANADIVENIQTISAITEEVSAHANETYNVCEENTRLVESVTGMVDGLNADAQKLQNSR
ncbi:MAG: methyl-accepting chemotaxis protein [Butyrivibrio sp.]|nr:methyl-accepting chemotaxis protein [Acetatifactor muris]MCM1561290.1 methyl-accepting chemotaxis protein [Butyrivibrio sp.]